MRRSRNYCQAQLFYLSPITNLSVTCRVSVVGGSCCLLHRMSQRLSNINKERFYNKLVMCQMKHCRFTGWQSQEFLQHLFLSRLHRSNNSLVSQELNYLKYLQKCPKQIFIVTLDTKHSCLSHRILGRI